MKVESRIVGRRRPIFDRLFLSRLLDSLLTSVHRAFLALSQLLELLLGFGIYIVR